MWNFIGFVFSLVLLLSLLGFLTSIHTCIAVVRLFPQPPNARGHSTGTFLRLPEISRHGVWAKIINNLPAHIRQFRKVHSILCLLRLAGLVRAQLWYKAVNNLSLSRKLGDRACRSIDHPIIPSNEVMKHSTWDSNVHSSPRKWKCGKRYHTLKTPDPYLSIRNWCMHIRLPQVQVPTHQLWPNFARMQKMHIPRIQMSGLRGHPEMGPRSSQQRPTDG